MLTLIGKNCVRTPALVKNTIVPLSRRPISNIATRRWYSNNEHHKSKDAMPSIWKLLGLSALGSGVFILASRNLDRKKNGLVQEQNAVGGLRRRVAMYQPGELTVRVVMDADVTKLPPTAHCVDTVGLLRAALVDENDPYQPLLAELAQHTDSDNNNNTDNDTKSNADIGRLIRELPSGLLVRLLAREFQASVSVGDTVYVTNFPFPDEHDGRDRDCLQDILRFESDVSEIDQLLVAKLDPADSRPAVAYYRTVGKVATV
ncbi:hypothetical protein TPHA_0C03740 [Tetrapisispora phaffii CBS 4417]|uniref:Altered inheritance of mitochondria protein 36, mitochondrial n=1 Tax=Tetrapisispora phaffii (strain ATCC 24235 / CBS 4417 / NBRC 1672 / NRRL Y-8282 / UCD 70-5) TaxID=1071381 RepID=G8BQL4_TETPH|nr:hypothetical protein TPHA_0C03740 [Tetrapisispora phaffii CBS 4417]CCE62526.1 hypothetical protein TPHA_0C03740 [Tetrapisispora phaffii CBS 4417]